MSILKYCKGCDQNKNINLFYNNPKMTSGKTTLCKICSNKRGEKHRKKYQENNKNKNYIPSAIISSDKFLLKIWNSIKNGRKSKGYENIQTKLTKKEFFDIAQKKGFYSLFQDWDNNKRLFKLTPSIDRINPDGHYEINNIQWLTVSENARRARTLNKDKFVKVNQFEKDGNLIKQHISVSDAAKSIGANSGGNISSCCSGKIKTAYGFVWKYVDN